MKLKNIRLGVYIFVLSLFAACGGGGGGGNPPTQGNTNTGNNNTGYFVDSAVSGLSYVTTSGITGITTSTGAFSYAPGDIVTFSIGGIKVGEVTGAVLITPVSLVTGAVDESDPIVVNIARFLQSLDADGDPSNGITIDVAIATAAASMGLDFTSVSFDSDATMIIESLRASVYGAGDTGTLIDAIAAKAHLSGSLLCERSGGFEGTFLQTAGPDSDSGTWSFTIDSDGAITGSGNSVADGAFDITGSVSSDGKAVVGNVSVGAEFTGTIGLDGSVSGTWTNSTYGTSGTYSGSRVTAPSCGTTSGGDTSGGGVIISPSESGTLTIAGADTVHFGTSFTPQYNWLQNPDRPAWQVTAGGRYTGIWVDIAADGTAFGVQFSNTDEITNDPPIYIYQLNCIAILNNPDCATLAAGVTVDLVAKTVTFNNLELPTYRIYNETAPITVNGTLSYTGTLVF